MGIRRRGASPAPQPGDPLLPAKLAGLERLRIAGLIDERTYEARQARLLAALQAASAASAVVPVPASSAASAMGPAPAVAAPAAPAVSAVGRAPAVPAPALPAPASSGGATAQPVTAAAAPAPALLHAPAPPRPQPAPPLPALPSLAPAAVPAAAPLAPTPQRAQAVQPRSRPRRTRSHRIPARAVAPALTGVLVLAGGATSAVLVTRHTHNVAPAVARTAPRVTLPSTATTTPDFDALSAVRYGQPATRGVVIDEQLAQQVVQAYWPVREYVLDHHLVDDVTALESGTAREWDTVACTGSCPQTEPRQVREVHVFVPRQAQFPASFLAEVLTTAPDHGDVPAGELVVFTRASLAQPWTLAFDAGFAQGYWALVDSPAATAGGLDATPRAFPALDPASLPAALAAYWQRWLDTGAAPSHSRFVTNDFTDGLGRDQHTAMRQLLARGYRIATTYTASRTDPRWTFAMSGGGAITCGTERWHSSITRATAGAAILQTADRAAWGDLLLPGRYADVSVSGLRQSCFVVAPGGAAVEVAGMSGGTTVMTGTRAA